MSDPAAPVQPAPGQSRYGALAAALQRRIVAGEWPPGTALPAETTLAGEHGVALGTLRQALQLLADQGLIERRHGRGTYVRSGLAGAPMLRFFRFGSGAETPASRILSRQTVPAPAEAARRLGIGRGEPVLRLQRLRSLGGTPCLLEDIWLPLPLFEALAEGDVAPWGDLLYPLFAERCGVHVTRAVDEIGFGRLGAAQARSLKLQAGHPCAVVTRQAYDLAGRCVELRTSRGDANAFHYTVTIT
ncbi:GntR family transcriptional regulator [Aquabacterium sp.]|uniref:GntR family transcriptional regulator n=1 Tax=Aquabacterium sp. TaxID=1872578 RepID=UPI003783DAFC